MKLRLGSLPAVFLTIGMALSACGGAAAPASSAPPAPASVAASKPAAASTAASAPASAKPAASGAAAGSAAAKPGGRLSVYSALNESTNNAFVAAFKQAYPG